MLWLDFDALLHLITTSERPKFPRANRDFTLAELEQLRALALREGQRAAGRPITSVRELTEADSRRVVNRLVKRATLLHTDVAALVAAAADTQSESAMPVPRPLLPLRTSVQIEDGQQVGVTFYGTHWDFARLLLDEVRPDPGRDVVVREWYRTIAALFASQHQWAESRAHLARARRLFPADAEILAANGRLHETFAAPRIQNFLETVGRADLTDSIGSPRSNLRQAETFFRKAVELDGGSVEARLHLGRVMTLEGRHEEAANQLARRHRGRQLLDAVPRVALPGRGGTIARSRGSGPRILRQRRGPLSAGAVGLSRTQPAGQAQRRSCGRAPGHRTGAEPVSQRSSA